MPHLALSDSSSSDVLRRSARCSRCGHKDTSTIMPSYVDPIVGFAPFPVGPQRAPVILWPLLTNFFDLGPIVADAGLKLCNIVSSSRGPGSR
jgi:hypothetical protein